MRLKDFLAMKDNCVQSRCLDLLDPEDMKTFKLEKEKIDLIYKLSYYDLREQWLILYKDKTQEDFEKLLEKDI